MTIGILVSQAVADADGADLLAAARAAGLDPAIVISEPGRTLSKQELDSVQFALVSVDVIGMTTMARMEPALSTMFDTLLAAPNARWMQVPSAGMDRPAYAELHSHGVKLSSAAGANAKAVAHTALAGLLAMARRVPFWVTEQHAHRWTPMRGSLIPPALEGTHAVVVGLGPIGQAIARLLGAFDVRVSGVRRSPMPQEGFESVVGFDAIDTILPQADWLVLACPLTAETRGLIDARRLALMPAGASIVNIARGAVIDEPALIAALQSGHLAAAYLDVFATEPLPADSPLWELPNVLMSAHCAGNSSSH
ncbi:hypothetical protein BH09PSE6_BH09PSE6_11510 [soil metagenome]